MKITDLTVKRYAQRREDGSRMGAEIQTVELATDAGVSGLGFVTAANSRLSPMGDLVAGILRTNLRNVVLGEDPVLTDALWQRMYEQVAGRRGARGLLMQCIAAVDFACWDIKGKVMGRPLGDLFGRRRERIPTYANAAHLVEPAEVARTAAEYVAQGHKALKIRGGLNAGSPSLATARVQAVREAIGPDVKLMVDVNGTWDADTAIQQLRAWERYELYWLEEPVSPEDVQGYVRVHRRAGNVYISGGEQHSGLSEFRNLLQEDAVDILQPGAAIAGGITEWLRVYNLACAYGVPVSPWDLQAVHIHMAAGLANVKWIEYFMADNQMLAFQNQLFKEPAFKEERGEDGIYLLPPDRPGLGIVLDEAQASRSLVEG
jgi:L-alanine-DL-glutamate epimerase-like enolase superfamily enzyme